LPLINFNSGSNTSTMVQNPSDLFGPMGVIQHICPDTSEEDDTWEQAKEAVLGVVQPHSFDSNPAVYIADKDYIWFDLSADQTVTVTIPAMLNTATFLELYSSNGDSLGITGTDELVFTSDTPNRYLVSISPDPDSPMRLNFGCEDVVGYDLLVVKSPLYGLFLPLVQH